MWAQVADVGFAGPAVAEGIDGLGSEAPDGHSPRLVDRTEERSRRLTSDAKPGLHGSPTAGGKRRAPLAPALADHGEHAGRRFVVVVGQAGSNQAADLAGFDVAAGRKAVSGDAGQVDGPGQILAIHEAEAPGL